MWTKLSFLGLPVVLGFLLDQVIGDPHSLYHPVQLIGKYIDFFEKIFRAICPKTKKGERAAGILCALCVMAVSTMLPWLVLFLLYHPDLWLKGDADGTATAVLPLAAFLVETFWCCQIVALKSLRVESMKVAGELEKGDLPAARRAVSMIVGRDTERLSETGVAKAAVETVAENCSDGIIAPLFYMMLFGAVGGFFYKSVNTMDSMIGYRNDKYRYFGTFAAKLDDVLNFLPARFAGILMTLAAGFCGYDRKNAVKIFLRDRKKHDSPNSAHTEAATAGALDIQLAGDAWYFGELHKKQYLGDPIRPVETEDIDRANKLAFAASVLSLLILWALRLLLVLLFS